MPRRTDKRSVRFDLTRTEHDFVWSAAEKLGVRDLSVLARAALLNRAQEILARSRTATGLAQPHESNPATPTSTLHAYIASYAPGEMIEPAVIFPSVRDFATALSDANRALLRFLSVCRPSSITDLAHQTAHDVQTLSQKLRTLQHYRLIAEQAPKNQSLVPALLHGRLRLIVPFSPAASDLSNPLTLAVRSDGSEPAQPGAKKIMNSMSAFCKSKFLTERSLEFLAAIAADPSASILDIARRTNRDPRNTYPAMRKLAKAGLITIEGPQPTKPVLCYDGIILDLIFLESQERF